MNELDKSTEVLKNLTVQEAYKDIVYNYRFKPCFAKNLKGEFIYLNEAFRDTLTSDHPDCILGYTDYDFFRKKVAHSYRQIDEYIFESGKPLLNQLEFIPSLGYRANWYFSHKVPIHDKSNMICGLFGTFDSYCNFDDLLIRFEDTQPKIKTLKPAFDYIKAHYQERIAIAQLAEVCEMAERTFYRRFKKNILLTPQNYLQIHRIIESLKLLSERSYPIAKIAQECGFVDHSNFTKAFKRHMRTTPKRYIQRTERQQAMRDRLDKQNNH